MAHGSVSTGHYIISAEDVRGGMITRWLVALSPPSTRASASRPAFSPSSTTPDHVEYIAIVRDGQAIAEFQPGAPLALPRPSSTPLISTTAQLHAPISGTLTVHNISSVWRAEIVFCGHAAQTEGHLCILCGADTQRLTPASRAVLQTYYDSHASASRAAHAQIAVGVVEEAATRGARRTTSTALQTTRNTASRPSLSTLLELSSFSATTSTGSSAPTHHATVVSSMPVDSTLAPGGLRSYKGRDGFTLKLSDGYAHMMDAARAARLRSVRRLTLVLDLDHTLIHAIEVHDGVGRAGVDSICATHDEVHVFTEGSATFAVKLRPRVRDFLRSCAALFELQVDTAATRAYARRVCDILDPTGELFGDRIVSRCDTKLKNQKETAWLHRSLTDHSMVLILDDTEAVWPGANNLILIERYVFWSQEQGHATNAPGQSHTTVEVESPPAADAAAAAASPSITVSEEAHAYLDDMHTLLSQLHSKYYARWDATGEAISTQELLAAHMSSVLRDVCLCFSGVFPLAVNPSAHPFYRRVLKFGAAISDSVWASTATPATVAHAHDDIHPLAVLSETPPRPVLTHVVARVGGTQKVYDAVACPAVRIVAVSWLEETCRRYARQEEAQHALQGYEAHATREQGEVVAALAAMRVNDDAVHAEAARAQVAEPVEAGVKRGREEAAAVLVPQAGVAAEGDADSLLHDSDLEASLVSGDTSGGSEEDATAVNGDGETGARKRARQDDEVQRDE